MLLCIHTTMFIYLQCTCTLEFVEDELARRQYTFTGELEIVQTVTTSFILTNNK